MENRQTAGSDTTDAGASADSSVTSDSAQGSRFNGHRAHPSGEFRRVLNRGAHWRQSMAEREPSSTSAPDGLGHAPAAAGLGPGWPWARRPVFSSCSFRRYRFKDCIASSGAP